MHTDQHRLGYGHGEGEFNGFTIYIKDAFLLSTILFIVPNHFVAFRYRRPLQFSFVCLMLPCFTSASPPSNFVDLDFTRIFVACVLVHYFKYFSMNTS